ncbi:hypothetical protein HBZS_122560 [Helicobacter bizzozeronii CCUG 35545]|nr:hypothetical protein HBZS_122560 [Helicobacter bizzozeronii CCUG 35545]
MPQEWLERIYPGDLGGLEVGYIVPLSLFSWGQVCIQYDFLKTYTWLGRSLKKGAK